MDDPEMRDVDFVVCMPEGRPPLLPDNVVSSCCQCGRRVQHRPSVPRELRKLCVDCGYERMMKDPRAEVRVTEQQAREIATLLSRGHH